MDRCRETEKRGEVSGGPASVGEVGAVEGRGVRGGVGGVGPGPLLHYGLGGPGGCGAGRRRGQVLTRPQAAVVRGSGGGRTQGCEQHGPPQDEMPLRGARGRRSGPAAAVASGGRQGEQAGPGALPSASGPVSSDSTLTEASLASTAPCPGPVGRLPQAPAVTSTKDPRPPQTLPPTSPAWWVDPATPPFQNLSPRLLPSTPINPHPQSSSGPSPVLSLHGPSPP